MVLVTYLNLCSRLVEDRDLPRVLREPGARVVRVSTLPLPTSQVPASAGQAMEDRAPANIPDEDR